MASNIDALIAAGPRPVQVDPNAIPNRIISLRQAMQGQQLQQEQIQAARQENQQRAILMDQTRASNDAYKAALTIGPDGTPTIDRTQLTTTLARNGHGSAIPGILKQLDETEQAHVNLKEAKGKVELQERDAGGAIGSMVRAAGYDPGVLMLTLSDAVRKNSVDGQQMAPLIQQLQQAQQQDPTGAAAKALTKQIADHMIGLSPKQQELDNARETADAVTKRASVEGDKAQLAKDAAYLQRVGGAQSQEQLDQLRTGAKAAGVSDAAIGQIPGMYSPQAMQDFGRQQMTSDQRATVDQAKATAAETAKRDQQTLDYQNALVKQGNSRLGLEQQRIGLETKKLGFDYGDAVSPEAVMGAQGRMAPPTLRAMIRQRPGLVGQILKIDPQFDEGNIDKRYDVIQDFSKSTPSTGGGQAIALNTMIHHADLYMQAARELKNGNFRPGNAIYNAIATEFGKAPPTDANLLAQFLVGETGKLVGEGTEGAQNKLLASIQNKNGPDQLMSAGHKLLEIAGGRATPLLERVKDAKADNVIHVIGSDAKEILARNGFDPNTMKPTQQGGRPAAAAAPPLPSTLSKADIGKTYMNKAGKLITVTDVDPKDGTRFAFNEAK